MVHIRNTYQVLARETEKKKIYIYTHCLNNLGTDKRVILNGS